MLLEVGAEVNVKRQDGWTPVTLAHVRLCQSYRAELAKQCAAIGQETFNTLEFKFFDTEHCQR